MNTLRFVLACTLIITLIVSIFVVSIKLQTSQPWFGNMTKEEFYQLPAEERLDLIVQQFDRAENVFNSSVLPIEYLRILISQDCDSIDIPETFTKYICNNIDHQLVEYNTDYQCNNPAVKVLNTGKASCLGMNILLANLILNYNDSIPTYLYFGTDSYLHHVITVYYMNNTWYALDPIYYYNIGIIQSSNYSYFLSEINKYTTYYYSLSPEGMEVLPTIER